MTRADTRAADTSKSGRGDATATMYDEPITLHLLGEEFYDQGLCGKTGGTCYDADGNPTFDRPNATKLRRHLPRARRAEHDENIPEPGTPERECVCPELTEQGKCIDGGRSFEPIAAGQLVTTGEIFNDLGYALAFPRYFTNLDYLAFSSSILWFVVVAIHFGCAQQWKVCVWWRNGGRMRRRSFVHERS